MKYLVEKNFNILVSLLLEGLGVGLILVPSHFNLHGTDLPVVFHGVMGLSSFLIALSLQITTVWETSSKRFFFIKASATIVMIVAGGMVYQNGQPISAAALWVGAIIQLMTWLLSGSQLTELNYHHLMIALISFSAGIILPLSSLEFSKADAYVSYLAAMFLVTAFLGGATVVLPAQKYHRALNLLQIIPWLWFSVLILFQGDENFVTPAAIISMLVLEKFIPWDRLRVPHEEILSRRGVAIAFFSEVAILIFTGALLHILDRYGYDHSEFTVLTPREGAFVFFVLFSVILYYATSTVIMTTNGLIEELNKPGNRFSEDQDINDNTTIWSHRLNRYLTPFIMTQEGIRGRIQTEQVGKLSRQIAIEKKRSTQLTLLLEFSQQLESQLDQPVSAQIAANTLERALSCGLVLVFLHEPETQEFVPLASAGRHSTTSYQRVAPTGLIGRTLRQRKTQIINDVRMEPDYSVFRDDDTSLSITVVPMISNGHVHGVVVLGNEQVNAYGSLEVWVAETVAAELVRAWERSGYQQRLRYLIQTGSQLSAAVDPESTANEVAAISRNITESKFTYVYIQLGQDREYIQTASSGTAPILLNSLMNENLSGELFKLALNVKQPFRIRDTRKYEKTLSIKIDNNGLKSLLVIPIRWHHVNIGAIFAFGKQKEIFFTENDESLAELISIQAGGAFESTWLQKELRSSLRITSLLYRLSNQIIQAENIEDATLDIAQTAHKLGKNITTGIVLLTPENEVIAKVKIKDDGLIVHSDHPMELILNTMQSGEVNEFSLGEHARRSILPIQTSVRRYGVIWMDTHEDTSQPASSSNDLQALINQAAIALERSLLLVESRRQAVEIKAAYNMLESTYDQTLVALTSALDARDRETEGHSVRVTHMAIELGKSLGYSHEQLKILERGALLHDIGKIGISDAILHKPGPLTEDEWKIMKLHPDIGAKIVEGIPFLEDTIQLIRHHQERWNGSGYPGGLSKKEIPEPARLFAVIDAFDALTSNRPYRQKITKAEALDYLKQEAGILFDPAMVSSFETLLQKNAELFKNLGK